MKADKRRDDDGMDDGTRCVIDVSCEDDVIKRKELLGRDSRHSASSCEDPENIEAGMGIVFDVDFEDSKVIAKMKTPDIREDHETSTPMSLVPPPPGLIGPRRIQLEPGAFAVSSTGVDGQVGSIVRRPTSPEMVACEETETNNTEGDNLVRNSSVLVSATLVTPETRISLHSNLSPDNIPVADAAPDYQEKEIQQQLNNARLKMMLCGLCVVIVALAVGLAITAFQVEDNADDNHGSSNRNSNRGGETLISPPAGNQTSLVEGVSSSPESYLRALLQSRLSSTNLIVMEQESSPQSKAFQWMLEDAVYVNLFSQHLSDVSADYRIIQRFSLATLYFGTGGPDTWKNKNKWLSASHECTWFTSSVEYGDHVCDESGTITSIVMKENGLNGRIPDEITLLGNLRNLDLSNNDLNGSIPSFLSNMQSLKVLSVANNYIEDILPTELGTLRSLEILHVNGNLGITGTIPETFRKLENLVQLWIFNTSVTCTVEQSICNLTLLNMLDPPKVDCNQVSCKCCECFHNPETDIFNPEDDYYSESDSFDD